MDGASNYYQTEMSIKEISMKALLMEKEDTFGMKEMYTKDSF
jgi:hypothetical protein